MIRRWGEAPVRGQAYRHRPGAYAILRLGPDVLLTVQAGGAADGGPEVQLPGGGVDPGEHPLAALHREVREETGWSIGGARRLGAYRRFAFMPEYDRWAEKVCHVWLARPVRRLGPPGEAGHVALWAPMDAAAGLVGSEGERAFLRRIMARGRSDAGKRPSWEDGSVPTRT